ncbi:MAG: DNA damage-inducible protein D, partial [Candidatus Delongbacteria bacterium]|nr:DNA damage-inducible protein D [Candidatus Delongbacteria bacterium]
MSNLIAKEYKPFESIKHISDDGNEFWYARELSNTLEYVQWRNFVKVLDRAKLACKNSGYEINDQFAEVSKMVEGG